jgi:hypothetical protein
MTDPSEIRKSDVQQGKPEIVSAQERARRAAAYAQQVEINITTVPLGVDKKHA